MIWETEAMPWGPTHRIRLPFPFLFEVLLAKGGKRVGVFESIPFSRRVGNQDALPPGNKWKWGEKSERAERRDGGGRCRLILEKGY